MFSRMADAPIDMVQQFVVFFTKKEYVASARVDGMDEHPQKHKHLKLDAPYHVLLHGGPTAIGGRAAEKVLQFVRDHGLPDAVGRKASRRQREDYVNRPTDYGPILKPLSIQLDDGHGSMDTTVVAPFPLLSRTVKDCAPFRKLMRRKLQEHPCTMARPWGIILYFDEVTPTDPRNTKPDKRKLQAFYWSFREFEALLEHEEVWFVASCTRSILMGELEVGMSQLVKDVLKSVFFNTDPFANTGWHHFALAGCTLELHETGAAPCVVKLYAVHWCTIADFLALKDVLNHLGHSALKPCPICKNITKADLAVGTLLPLHSLDKRRYQARTDQSIGELMEWMGAQHGVLGNTKFKELESRHGYHYNPLSILNDGELMYKPIKTLMFDWPHVYIIGGIFQYDMEQFMIKARAETPSNQQAIINYNTLGEHLANWVWPSRWSSCKDVFSKGKLDATASEILSVMPVVRHFFDEIVLKTPSLHVLHPGAVAISSLCDGLEALLCASRLGITSAELHERIVDHLGKAQAAFGTEYWKFKHHMPMHLADMYRLFQRLIASFVTERKHRNPKRLAFARRTQSNYEWSILSDLVLQHFQDWNDFVDGHGLISPHQIHDRALRLQTSEAFPLALEIQTAVEYKSRTGAKFHVGDHVLLASTDLQRVTLGKIWHFLDVDGAHWTVLSTWPSRRVVRNGVYAMYSYYNPADETPLLVSSSVLACLAIVRITPSSILAIVPRMYQLGKY